MKEIKEIKTEVIQLNMGPQHPATHGVLRLLVELEGEIIVNITPIIGYLHRGMEKIAENLKYESFLPFPDRLDYVSTMGNNLAYVQAVEKLIGVEVPKRAKYIRTIMAELSRIASHLIGVTTAALDLGATTPFFYGFRDREFIYDIFEVVCGARMTTSYFRIGGLREDPPPKAFEMIKEFAESVPRRVNDIETLLTKNRIFMERVKGVGVISDKDAINLGLSGPSLRGSGVKWDIRKAEPYAAYSEVEFDVPIGGNGDAYDRYMVRMEEMRQSARIILQALKQMPKGPVRADLPDFIRPPKELANRDMAALATYCYITIHGGSPPPGEIYSAVENPKGELGFYIVSDGSPKPLRLKIRGPSFNNLQALKKMLIGRLFSDVVAVIGSIDICLGEVDR